MGATAADDATPWPARRSGGTDLSAAGLVALALVALALVALLFILISVPGALGAASVVPVVAFGGIAIIALVRVLRREGRPRT